MKPREMKQKIKIKENEFFIIYNEKKISKHFNSLLGFLSKILFLNLNRSV